MLLHYALLVSSIAFYCYLLYCSLAWPIDKHWTSWFRGCSNYHRHSQKVFVYRSGFPVPDYMNALLIICDMLAWKLLASYPHKKNNSRDSFRSWESCKKRRSNGSRRSWRFRRRKRSNWTFDRCNTITQGDKNQRRCDNADFLWCNVTML